MSRGPRGKRSFKNASNGVVGVVDWTIYARVVACQSDDVSLCLKFLRILPRARRSLAIEESDQWENLGDGYG
jgi:hypothetical protein